MVVVEYVVWVGWVVGCEYWCVECYCFVEYYVEFFVVVV